MELIRVDAASIALTPCRFASRSASAAGAFEGEPR
jgi:hypothetical protein